MKGTVLLAYPAPELAAVKTLKLQHLMRREHTLLEIARQAGVERVLITYLDELLSHIFQHAKVVANLWMFLWTAPIQIQYLSMNSLLQKCNTAILSTRVTATSFYYD